jgi:class 3 adenylate cyclase
MSSCRACGAEVLPIARFCPACGTRIESAGPVGERKLATVLFADLVESTSLGSLEDPERTRALLERFYDAMRAEVEAVGGTVEKFAGDAVMAAFGAPASQEDHGERALHAAVAMRRRLTELFGDRLSIRIGVNTGEVVVGAAREGSSFVTGDAVNVAARLEQAASPGEILAGERTVAAVGRAFEFGERQVVEAKGKPAGVACRALGVAVSPMRPRGVAGLHTAFIGREQELELLQATYRSVVSGAEPHLVSIVGDAGIGKTRLVRELWRWLAGESAQPLQRSGRCLSYGRGLTYWPLGEILREHFGILEGESPESVLERLDAGSLLGLSLGLEVAGGLHPLIVRDRFQDAWVEFLAKLSTERPVVVLVEDLHWAEGPLLDLLEHLIEAARGPLLVLATARPELLDRRPGWGAGAAATLLHLEPLSQGASELLLSKLLEVELPLELLEQLVERAEGNPFFVEELIGALIDRGLIELKNGHWTVTEPPLDFDVPDSVQAVLAARIDLLEPAEKEALQAASVIGRVFWTGPIYELLEGFEPDFRVLEERDFIRRRPGSSMAGQREYMIKHALTRDVAYASLPKTRRASLHAAFADWLERVGGERDEWVPLLGHHFAEAVRPEDVDLAWPGGDDEVDRLRKKAVLWLRRAAELAAGRYALDEEIALLDRAAELETSAASRVQLQRAIGHANALKYEKEAFWRALLDAIELSDDAEAVADIYSDLAFQTAFRFQHAEDRELIDAWIDRALQLAPATSAARARALVARSYSDPAEAERWASESGSIAERLPELELRSYAYRARADSALAEGRYADARRWAERRLELRNEIGDPDHIADVYWSAIPGYLAEARFDEARRLARLHNEATRDLTPHHRLHGIAFVLEVEELAANWEAISELAPRAEQAVRDNEATPCVHNPRSLLVCALAEVCLGDENEARRLESLADSFAEQERGRVFDTRIRLALVRSDLEPVERLLAESEVPKRALIRSTKFAPVAARLDALAALGQRERVEAETPPLLRAGTYIEPFALRALGVVRGDSRLVEEAAERFAAMGLAWYTRQTRALLVAGP